jgi:hypothetical protein
MVDIPLTPRRKSIRPDTKRRSLYWAANRSQPDKHRMMRSLALRSSHLDMLYRDRRFPNMCSATISRVPRSTSDVKPAYRWTQSARCRPSFRAGARVARSAAQDDCTVGTGRTSAQGWYQTSQKLGTSDRIRKRAQRKSDSPAEGILHDERVDG